MKRRNLTEMYFATSVGDDWHLHSVAIHSGSRSAVSSFEQEAEGTDDFTLLKDFFWWVKNQARAHGKKPILVNQDGFVRRHVDDRHECPFEHDDIHLPTLLFAASGTPLSTMSRRSLPVHWRAPQSAGPKEMAEFHGRLVVAVLDAFQRDKSLVDELVDVVLRNTDDLKGIGPNTDHIVEKMDRAATAVARTGFSGWRYWWR